MSETTHANDAIHRARSGDAAGAASNGHGAAVDTAHEGHAGGAPLGPIDWRAWGAGLLGIMAGLVVAACLYVATSL